MTALARLARKIRINKKDDIYLIVKSHVIEGTIDDSNNFSFVEENGNVERIKLYSDTEFLTKPEEEYCYCDEYDMNDLIEQYPKLKSTLEIKKQFKSNTDSSFYIAVYDKYSQTSTSLKFDKEQFLDVADMLDAFDQVDELILDDILPIAYFKEYVLTTIKGFKNLTKQVEDGDIDGALLQMQTACENYDLQYDEEKKKKIEDAIENANEQAAKEKEKVEEKTFEQILEELYQLIGMQNIKKQVNKLSTYLQYIEKNKELGLDLNLEKPNLNMVFLGNPGTGKTTVARIISLILNKLGYANGKFKEVSAQDFIAGYIGQTALKTEKLLKEIHGGVLFIDEAYSLTIGGEESSSYGEEAIAVLLKEMEKNETVFIFSGYKQEMEKFIKSNSGLTSRIKNNFEFKDYSVDELMEMFNNKVKKSNFLLDDNILDEVRKVLEKVTREKNFGNGRYIDKLFEDIVLEHAYNIANSNDINELKTLTTKDLVKENIEQLVYKKSMDKKIGFINN